MYVEQWTYYIRSFVLQLPKTAFNKIYLNVMAEKNLWVIFSTYKLNKVVNSTLKIKFNLKTTPKTKSPNFVKR